MGVPNFVQRWEPWHLRAVERAKRVLAEDPKNGRARNVLEQFAAGRDDSFDWLDFDDAEYEGKE